MANVHNILCMGLAFVAGASFVVQQAVNSNLSTELGSAWWAGFVSYLGGTVVMMIMLLLTKAPSLTASSIGGSSWWSWSGGLFGAIYIAISIVLLPRMGAFTVVSLIVVGQLATSLLVDHFGVLHVPHYTLTLPRTVGAAFLVAGTILIRW